MLLNKLLVLDKGSVALISSSLDSKRLKELSDGFFKAQFSPDVARMANATLYFKCPLFIQLNVSKFGFKIASIPPKDNKPEAWKPDQTYIKSGDLQMDKDIADDIGKTTEALLINPKAYQHDKCDVGISQVITPINVYTELIIHGPLQQWCEYLDQSLPDGPLKMYQEAVEQLLEAEWKNLDEYRL